MSSQRNIVILGLLVFLVRLALSDATMAGRACQPFGTDERADLTGTLIQERAGSVFLIVDPPVCFSGEDMFGFPETLPSVGKVHLHGARSDATMRHLYGKRVRIVGFAMRGTIGGRHLAEIVLETADSVTIAE